MTTKQDIIDYIKEHIYQYSYYMGFSNRHECDKLTQMIKDLKPKVKPLKFQNSDNGNSYICNNIFNYNIEINHEAKWCVYINDNLYCAPYNLQESQDACQEHYEEFILGELEELT